MIAYLEKAGKDYEAQQAQVEDAGLVIAPKPVNTYQAEIEEFSQAVIEGRESVIGGELGLRSQKILAACYESARTEKAIDVC